MEYEISNRLSGVHGSMIRELFKLGASKDIISFGGGNPSAETFPCKEIEDIAANGLSENPVSLFSKSKPSFFSRYFFMVSRRGV